jgi:hypothetical protein
LYAVFLILQKKKPPFLAEFCERCIFRSTAVGVAGYVDRKECRLADESPKGVAKERAAGSK